MEEVNQRIDLDLKREGAYFGKTRKVYIQKKHTIVCIEQKNT